MIKAQEAVESFTNPFIIEDNLVSFSSGASATKGIEAVALRAEMVGKDAKEAFVKDTLG